VNWAEMSTRIKNCVASSYNTYQCLDVSQSVFPVDSHHPPIEILADVCRKTLLHLTAAQPTHVHTRTQQPVPGQPG